MPVELAREKRADLILKGILAHELSHIPIYRTGGLLDFYYALATGRALPQREFQTDESVIEKGLGEELYWAKLFSCGYSSSRGAGPVSGHSVEEIWRLYSMMQIDSVKGNS